MVSLYSIRWPFCEKYDYWTQKYIFFHKYFVVNHHKLMVQAIKISCITFWNLAHASRDCVVHVVRNPRFQTGALKQMDVFRIVPGAASPTILVFRIAPIEVYVCMCFGIGDGAPCLEEPIGIYALCRSSLRTEQSWSAMDYILESRDGNIRSCSIMNTEYNNIISESCL